MKETMNKARLLQTYFKDGARLHPQQAEERQHKSHDSSFKTVVLSLPNAATPKFSSLCCGWPTPNHKIFSLLLRKL